MTKREAIKFLEYKKVFVKNKGKEIQDKLFELGYNWGFYEGYKDAPFIYISEPNYSLGCGNFNEKGIDYFYNHHNFKEISVEDILNIEIEESLPKTWEEFYIQNKFPPRDLDTFYKYNAHKKLLHLRDCYRQGWKPEIGELRWVITSMDCEFYINSYYNICRFLSFQSEEVAKEFLKNFKDLIIQAGDFI